MSGFRIVRRLLDLLDVNADSIADGETLLWDAGAEEFVPGSGGGGGAPSGAAGGVLGGTYPDPSFAADMATQAELDAHVNDTSAAHAGTAISNTPAGNVAATTVQAAIDELDGEKAALSHVHAGEDITSGTVADARIASTIARDSEVTAAVAAEATARDTAIGVESSARSTADALLVTKTTQVIAGAALTGGGALSGNVTLDVGVDGSTIEVSSDAVRVKDAGITAAKIAAALKPSGSAAAGDEALRALGTSASTAAAGNDSRLSDSRSPSGSAGGDLTGTYPNPTLGAAGPGATGPIGDATHVAAVTIDAKGRVTALSSVAVAAPAMARSARSSNTILAAADKGQVICATAAYTQTFTAAATLGAGWWCIIKNDTSDGTTVLTLDPNSTETIDALATTKMYSGECRLIECDGSNFFSQLLEGGYAKFTPGSSTFVVPAGIAHADVVCIGGGGQGGGGASSVSTAKSGGGGGGGGAVSRAALRPGDLGASGASITVTVGAGGSGSGGGGAAGAGADGSSGANGAQTTFGTLLKAGGGGGGIGGTSGTAVSGGGGGSAVNSGATSTAGAPASSTAIGGQGATPPGAGGAGTQAEWGGASGGGCPSGAAANAGGSSIYGGPGGGGGGGITAGNASRAGGAGGANQSVASGGGGGAGAPPSGGTFVGPYCGTGAGGGTSGAATTGADGAVGSIGAGGGGGGCSSSASSSTKGGDGGAGGAGECRVWYY